MKVKKILFILGVSFFLGGLFSCSTGMGQDVTEEEKTEEEKTGSGSIKGVSFNISDLTSLAIADETTATRSAARSTVSEGMLVKLLEDGTVENFINVPEGVTLAPVSFVTQSPASNSKEIYIVFEYDSSVPIYETVTDEWGNSWEQWVRNDRIGELLCVYEDGSFVDVLATEDGLWKSLCNNGNQDSPIKFDGQGNMYYQVWESAGNSSTSMIYKFDPKKKESKQLTPQVPNVSYNQFYVSTDGNWIFAKASRYNSSGSSTNYLRAIPVSDANNPVNLFYDSTGSKWLDQWVYDEVSKNVYYTIDGGLYRIPYKNGTYNQESKELILGNEEYINIDGCVYWDELFFDDEPFFEYEFITNKQALDINNYYDYKDYYFVDANTLEMDYKEILDYHFGLLYESSYDFKGCMNDYEIRFDEFANVEGFEELALKTKDENGKSLTDLELIKAIFEKDLIQLLGKAMYTYYTETNIYNEYKHNYIADIMYLKESGEKIDFTKFDSYSSKNNSFSISYGSYNSCFNEYECRGNWKAEFVNSDTGVVVPEKVLSFLAKKCGVSEIDFSLECFKNDANFNELYTDKKNKEAIMFVNSSRKRIDLLYRFIGSYYNVFLNKTCFLPGTDTPACNINNGDNKTPINYWGLENLTLVGQTLYATDRLNNGKLVMLIDENANPVGKFLDIDYESELKVASTLVHNGVFYFQNAIVNASGEEVGAHKILRLDPTDSSIEDMFYNMPNNTTFEVVSYTVGGQNLYCCLTKGTEIQTVKIDVTTKKYTQLASGTKLKQIIIVK